MNKTRNFGLEKFDDFVSQERFIPVSRVDLTDRLLQNTPETMSDTSTLRDFFHFLHEWRHRRYASYLSRLQEEYVAFNPDRDTLAQTGKSISTEARHSRQKQFRHKMSEVLFQANYRPIAGPELTALMDTQSVHNLQVWVELEEFEEILVYYRGLRRREKRKRDWRKAYLAKKVDFVPIYDRVFVLLKVKSEEKRVAELVAHDRISEKTARKHVRRMRKTLPTQVGSENIHMKLFKNMPLSDLAMLFPNLHIQFKLYDRLLLWGLIAGGAIASLIATVPKVMDSAGLMPLTIALTGFGLAIYQQISRFTQLRTKYKAVLSRRLYFHSLADNAAVLTLLANRAAEEDLKEDLLLYWTLLRSERHRHDLESFKAEAEQFVFDQFKVKMVFDAEEALARLKRDGLIEERSGGLITVVLPEEAMGVIRQKWSASLGESRSVQIGT